MKPPKFKKHPYFDLMLPSDELLLKCVGAAVMERRVCHEWPLSCVEQVTFEGGIKKYCKTMHSPSMEIEVYANLRSPIFVPYLVVAQDEAYSVILLDAFPGQRLSTQFVERSQFSEFVAGLKIKLTSISGQRPVFVNLSTSESIESNMTVMLDRLHRHFGQRTTTPIDPALLEVVRESVSNHSIRDAFTKDVVYSNGDLSADNILVVGEELRVIDWQFPRLAALNVELVNLYTSVGIEPLTRLSKAEVGAGILCKIRWFAECADKWLPTCSYHKEITGLITQLRDL